MIFISDWDYASCSLAIALSDTTCMSSFTFFNVYPAQIMQISIFANYIESAIFGASNVKTGYKEFPPGIS